MAYTIKKSNGQTLTVIQDGTVDTVSTGLQLPGRNYSGYGFSLNQSLIYLLENFASNLQPANKVVGQLWFDSSVKKIKVFNGIDFKSLSNAEYGDTPPGNQLIGDFWFNTTTGQLFVFDGTTHKLIGPPLTNPSAAQLINRRLVDSGGNTRTILQAAFGDDVIAVFSKDEFNVNQSQTPLTGFDKIFKGITLSSRNNFPNIKFGGVAKTSESLLVNDQEIPSANFVQNVGQSQLINTDIKLRVEPNVTQSGEFSSLRGLFLGSADNFYLGFNSGNGFISNLSGPAITFSSNDNGTVRRIASFNNTSLYPERDSIISLGSSDKKWKEVVANKFIAQDDPTLAPNNSSFIGKLDDNGKGIVATGGIVGNLTGNVKGDILKLDNTPVLTISGITPVFNGRTNGLHYGNVINQNAVPLEQNAVDVSGPTTIFRGAFSGVSETATSIKIGSTNYPGFVGTSAQTISNPSLFSNTIVARDANGDVVAPNFIGLASTASSIIDTDGSPRLASISNVPFTVVVRDSEGNVNAQNAGSAQDAERLNGLVSSVPNVNSTIVARDTGGDIFVSVMHGTATSARYADLAEKYLADADYEVGTVVIIGGEKEITACKWGKRAIGAVSAKPAYLMNSNLKDGTPVALKGRVPVKVIGTIKKGDELIASDNGCAVMSVPHSNGVFAIALESNEDTGIKLVECLIL